MKKLFFLLLFILSITVSNAQYIKEFSLDTANYIQELSTLFGTSLMDEEEEVFKQFKTTWDSLDFGYREDIMEVSDLMRQRSCRPRTQYLMFLKILLEFHGEDKLALGYDEWIAGYMALMQNEQTLLKDINSVNKSVFLLLDQSLIYQATSLHWELAVPDYTFVYDDRMKIRTEQNQILGISAGDTIRIHKVTGYLDPLNNRFVGESARVLWVRAGLDPETVYADLGHYRIDLSKPGYTADTVTFFHLDLLDAPAIGKLEDRISQIRKPEQATYPRFISYKSSYELKDIVEGLNYSGAIAMQGANLAGTGKEGEKARLEIYYNDTLCVRMHSSLFLFGKQLIKSVNAEVSLYVEADSIYHPDLVMTYDIRTERMRLSRSKDYNSQGPYTNSYHQVDMSFDELNWVRTEPVIRMQPALGSSIGNGFFESHDFFNMAFYESLQGMEYQNPLAELWTFGNMLGGSTFNVEAYSDYMGKAPYQIRHQLMQLTKLGFVYFDFEQDAVTLRPKLYDFIQASLKQRDYDVIRFISRTQGGNQTASLNLETKDLTINGVPAIFLSDSQNVKLVPADNRIIMKRNRNFQFNGTIDAGLFKFYGNNFFFEYDSFKINLQNIDSLSISAKTNQRDASGRILTTTLDNNIEKITGELLIDHPLNKSGRIPYPVYPIFVSNQSSYVYFDEKTIQNGVYDKDRFYFQLVPFTIDSLDNFQREALKMQGKFVSADILPPVEMEMTLRPDNSLGFYLTTPAEGIPIYGGEAIFYNDIEMSSSGLHGYGTLDYLTSTTWSDDFLFHPDSLVTTSRRFLEREQAEPVSFPLVENDVADVRYYPFDDVLNISRIENVFRMYDDSIFFGGNLALRPIGLSGTGGLGFPDARFDSESFHFLASRFLADSAGVRMKRAETDTYTFVSDDLKLDVDLEQGEGDFTARADYTLVKMPENLYETRLNRIRWFMDRSEVLMTQTIKLPENDVDIGIDSLKTNGPSYVSIHPRQDSLNFVAPEAYFHYASKVLKAGKVPFIEVGDAYIFPDAGKVEILEEATMTPLNNARLLANKDTRYHLLHHAYLVVNSRNHYRGSADYDYIDEFGNVYTFRMNHVEVDTALNSFGKGEIPVDDAIMLSPYFQYQGLVSMDARKPFLDFAGGTKLTYNCDMNQYWLKFETEIDPDSIMIPVESRMQNTNLVNIYAGTLKARDSIHIYPTFLSGRKQYFDRNVTFSDGYLYYDKYNNAYEIGSLEKLTDMSNEGNYLALRADSCDLVSEGVIDLQLDYGRIDLKTVGTATHDIDSNSLDLNLIMGMDFYFSREALNMFGNELDSLPDLEPANLTSDLYQLAITNIAGKMQAERLDTELGLYGSYNEIPDSPNFSILFNDLPLKWNQETRSYRHNGKVGVGIIGDLQVNKKVDAYIEFVERGSGDIFDIYLMVDENTWYYLAYSPGGFQVLSSSRDFNELIFELPDKERKLKSRGRQPSYIYSLASQRRLGLFLNRFLQYEDESGGE
jgi:hypothetical protein